jgi:hypothetical protein
MTGTEGTVRWRDIRAEQVARSGGEVAVEAGKAELLAQVVGHRLAEVRRARGFTQAQIAERMGVTKGRVSQIERGQVSRAGGPGPVRRSVGRAAASGDLFRRRRHRRHRLTNATDWAASGVRTGP